MILHAVLLTTLIAAAEVNLAETEASPEAARQLVQREFRAYRITIYNTYRTQRVEYNRRYELGQMLHDKWQAAGRDATDAVSVVQWYRQAADATLQGVGAVLPEMPPLDAVAAVNEAPRADTPVAIDTSVEPTPPPESQVASEPIANEPIDGRQFELSASDDDRDPFDDSETEQLRQEFPVNNEADPFKAKVDEQAAPPEVDLNDAPLDLPLTDPNDKLAEEETLDDLTADVEVAPATETVGPHRSAVTQPPWFTGADVTAVMAGENDLTDEFREPNFAEALGNSGERDERPGHGSGDFPSAWTAIGKAFWRAATE